MQYLYRGISPYQYDLNYGRLVPKIIQKFIYQFHWGEITWGSGGTWGPSEANAVIRHQLDGEGFHTSGISTTPHIDRAKYYATSGGMDASGWIYKIDRYLLSSHGVREFTVAKFSPDPSVPEDDEVILVGSDFGSLPETVIVEIIHV